MCLGNCEKLHTLQIYVLLIFESGQVTFIYIALFIKQIVSKSAY